MLIFYSLDDLGDMLEAQRRFEAKLRLSLKQQQLQKLKTAKLPKAKQTPITNDEIIELYKTLDRRGLSPLTSPVEPV